MKCHLQKAFPLECSQKFNSFNPISVHFITYSFLKRNSCFASHSVSSICKVNNANKMEITNNERKLETLEQRRDSISHSFSYDGYEQLHDEAMDKISVSILYSEGEEKGNSRRNSTNDSSEKKLKISLSQEQLRLHCGSKNLLSVPKSSRKARSASFSSVDMREATEVLTTRFPVPIMVESKSSESSSASIVSKIITVTPPSITSSGADMTDEIIYAVPRKSSLRSPWLLRKAENEIKTSSASSSPLKSVATAQTSSTAELNRNFKYPLAFYCTICNNVLNDPRLLDCLHSFCVQCLARLDASNDLQNNQFWRKISEHSDSSCEFLHENFRSLMMSISSSPVQASSVLSSMESDNVQKAKFSISGSLKSRKLLKDKASFASLMVIDIID